jgi:integrase
LSHCSRVNVVVWADGLARGLHAPVRAGLPPETRLYDLRHACASLLLAPRVVADLLGHSTTRLTMDTYSHVLPTLARSAANRLDAILSSDRLQ